MILEYKQDGAKLYQNMAEQSSYKWQICAQKTDIFYVPIYLIFFIASHAASISSKDAESIHLPCAIK